MEIAQEREWAEAQKIELSLENVAAAKRHLQFLAAVDHTGCLYDGPALLKAIYRYNACWLPLLAKHAETPLCEGPIVVPLDCEWIWHCHRLNPLRYISDCKELFGRLLDNRHVVSSVEGYSKKQTEKIWSKLLANEPYELDFSKVVVEDGPRKSLPGGKFTDYDLVSAVARQSSFYWQVSRPHMSDDLFLQESVARYKAFLYLMKKNMEKAVTHSCVPTYDIDLIWHTHQLHPFSYCKDLIQFFGKVVEHDDTDSDRSEGNNLDVGFKRTTQQWEEMFGRSYWRAGAMYRGNAPNPAGSQSLTLCDEHQKPITAKLMEVLVEFTGVRSIPEGIKLEDLFVSLHKKQPDMFFRNNEGINLRIQGISGERKVALFCCEPTGELLFELKSQHTSSTAKDTEVLGSATLSLNEFLDPVSALSVRRWIELAPPTPRSARCEPIVLHVALSFTVPVPVTTQMLHMLQHEPSFWKGKANVGGACGGGGGCSGKCKGLTAGSVGGGGGCSGGGCSGRCKGLPAVSVGGGGGCSGGGCSGRCKGLPAVSVGGGGCGGGGCSGRCKGLPAAG